MAKTKEKETHRSFNLKQELKLAPGYIIILLWVIFTIVLLGWVFCASFSTTVLQDSLEIHFCTLWFPVLH